MCTLSSAGDSSNTLEEDMMVTTGTHVRDLDKVGHVRPSRKVKTQRAKIFFALFLCGCVKQTAFLTEGKSAHAHQWGQEEDEKGEGEK